jgi:hypothetical protein
MTAPQDRAPALGDGRVPATLLRPARRAAAVVAAAGALGSLAALAVDPRRFGFAWLTAFAWVTTLAVGALIFVLLQHVTRAGWSTAARRQMEWVASSLPPLALGLVPLALLAPRIYEWLSPAAQHDPVIAHKHAYLNGPAFVARALVFFAVWAGVARAFTRLSRRQDQSAAPAIETVTMQRASAPAIIAIGVTLSFAGFDWLMSLDPRWYSTIFGVYVIAGAIVSSLALLACLTLVLERGGVFGAVSTVEHRHDIGKLLFGFTVFWAYIAFCQYFLIWYAGIPEETIFYRHRWVGSWQGTSVLLALGHFAVPFILLLSRGGKRSPAVLGAAALVLIAMHYLDLYWLVMPTLDQEGIRPTWIDGAALLGCAGALALWLTHKASREPAWCVRDPRLPEALRLENF